MSANKLKQLNTELSQAKQELAEVRAIKNEADARLNTTTQRISSLESKIASLQKEPVVSEHAILRYLEREYNLNLAEVEDKILSQKNRELISKMDWIDGTYPMENGLRLVLKNKTVVTVKP